MKHQPIVAVKKEKKEEAAVKITQNVPVVPEIVIPAEDESTTMKQVSDETIQVKQEISPSKNINEVSQTQIDTDFNDTETEDEDDQPLLKRKKLTRKRIIYSESESENETSKKKVNRKKRKVEQLELPTSSNLIKDVHPEQEVRSPERPIKTPEKVDQDERKVSDLKSLIKILSEGKTKDPKKLLSQFETIVGKQCFSTLKSLFVGASSSTSMSPHELEGKSNGSGSDDQPLMQQESRKADENKSKKKKKRKKRTELEKLKDDIMEMYIRDGVLSAHGLRHHKRIPYVEDDVLKDFETDDESMPDDDDSVNCQKGSSIGDRSQKENSPSENADQTEEEEKKSLSDCKVMLKKLDLTGIKMPVIIDKDGNIKPLPGQAKTEKILTLRLDTTAGLQQITPIKNPNTLNNISSEGKCQESLELPVVATLPSIESLQGIVSNCANEVTTEVIPSPSSENNKAKIRSILFRTETPLVVSPSPSKTIISFEKTVCNLSYVYCRTGIMLKCNTEKCKFEQSNHQLFQYHIQTRHLLAKWSGSCKLCNKSVSDFGSLLDEYNHMFNKHIRSDTGMVTNEPSEYQELPPKKKGERKRKTESTLEARSLLAENTDMKMNNPSEARSEDQEQPPKKKKKSKKNKKREKKKKTESALAVESQSQPAENLVSSEKAAEQHKIVSIAPLESSSTETEISSFPEIRNTHVTSPGTLLINPSLTPLKQSAVNGLPSYSPDLIPTTVANLEKPSTASNNPHITFIMYPKVSPMKTPVPTALDVPSKITPTITTALNSVDEPVTEKPQIILKLRHLPGDKLSTIAKKDSENEAESAKALPKSQEQAVSENNKTKIPQSILLKPVTNDSSERNFVQVPVQFLNIMPISPLPDGSFTKQRLRLVIPKDPISLNQDKIDEVNGGNDLMHPTHVENMMEEDTQDVESFATIKQLRLILPQDPTSHNQDKFDQVNNIKRLKPWLGRDDLKHPTHVENMLAEDCLVDLYKCMGSRCDFHTQDVEKFAAHLKEHEESRDLEAVGRCPYCKYSTAKVTNLVTHVETEHKCDRYACTKCFYRSVVEHYVNTHQTEFHNNESNTVLDCVAEKINNKEAVQAVMESRSKFILPILCVCK